jgi:hypothetical protein
VAARPHPWDRGTMALAAAVGHVEPTGLLLGSLGSLAPPKASATDENAAVWLVWICVQPTQATVVLISTRRNSAAAVAAAAVAAGRLGSRCGPSRRCGLLACWCWEPVPCAVRCVCAGVSLRLASGSPCLGVCTHCDPMCVAARHGLQGGDEGHPCQGGVTALVSGC